jgi:hypothetical protein
MWLVQHLVPALVIVVITIIIIIIISSSSRLVLKYSKYYRFQDHVLNAANDFTSFVPLTSEVRVVAVLETLKNLSADKKNETDRCNVPAVSIKLVILFSNYIP